MCLLIYCTCVFAACHWCYYRTIQILSAHRAASPRCSKQTPLLTLLYPRWWQRHSLMVVASPAGQRALPSHTQEWPEVRGKELQASTWPPDLNPIKDLWDAPEQIQSMDGPSCNPYIPKDPMSDTTRRPQGTCVHISMGIYLSGMKYKIRLSKCWMEYQPYHMLRL